MSNCPIYKNNYCVLKKFFNKEFNKLLFQFDLVSEQYTKNCLGLVENCCFTGDKKEITPHQTQPEEQKNTENETVSDIKESNETKITIHKLDNPYLVKSDVIVYPINNELTIDDPLLHRLSRGNVQIELDKFKKPIKMGAVYITSNGGENSKVQPKSIYHAVVSGPSRLVNEEDIKSSVRKSLHLAKQNEVRNIVMMPPDCGTHDINDTARVHLSAVKTFLQTEKNSNIKNIFIVMSDQDSYDAYQEYYKRVFKK